MKVLALIDGYLPGFRHGGPVRTLAAMVERLAPAVEFWIFTRNHDRGSETPYPGVLPDAWTSVGPAHVYYGSRRSWNLRTLLREIRAVQPDVVYANSFFARNTVRILVARRLGLLSTPIVVAPRGEAAPSALGLKAVKKRLYLRTAAAFGLLGGIVWQASSERERSDIAAMLPAGAEIRVAPNLSTAGPELIGTPSTKRPGKARFVFVSRIAPMKNLAFGIDRLAEVEGEVALDVFGPVDDPAYWAACETRIRALPERIRVRYHGPLQPEAVGPAIAAGDFFLLPTLGENFGHVIREALTAGCPVLLSDRTPWKVDDVGAGWALPLEEPARWRDALTQAIGMAAPELAAMRAAARRAATGLVDEAGAIDANLSLFQRAAGG